jgi:hypothetical protein
MTWQSESGIDDVERTGVDDEGAGIRNLRA